MRTIKIILISLILVVLSAGYVYGNMVKLALIDYSSFQNIGGNVYLSETLPEGAEDKVQSLLKSARERIANHYGEPIATPVTVVLGNKVEQKSYGLNGPPGQFSFAPWGNYLLLNYESANIDITAHELVHAEILSRVGYIKRQLNIPTWFDEGAAMQVDYRVQYLSNTAIAQDEFYKLISLDTPAKFWSSNKVQNINHYRDSKAVMAEILRHSDSELYSLLEKIRHGDTEIINSAVSETSAALNF